jgi:predicted P-loop ATPase
MPAFHQYFLHSKWLPEARSRAIRANSGYVRTLNGDWDTLLTAYYNEARTVEGKRVATPRKLPEVNEIEGVEPTIDDKKRCLPLLFFGEFRGGRHGYRRSKENVVSLHAIGVDLDGKQGRAPHFDDVVAFTETLGVRAEVHTTTKHTEASPRVRVLFLLGDPVPAESARAVWTHLVGLYEAQGWEKDAQTKDHSRGWYAPTPGEPGFRVKSLPGKPFAWADIAAADRADRVLHSPDTKFDRLRGDSVLTLESGETIEADALLDSLALKEKVRCFCPTLEPQERRSCSGFATVHQRGSKRQLFVYCASESHLGHTSGPFVGRYSQGGVTPTDALPGANPVADNLIDLLTKTVNKKTGAVSIKKTAANLDIILEHDPMFAGHIRLDTFTRRPYYQGEMFKDSTPSFVQRYLSATYGVEWAYDNVGKSMALQAENNTFDQRVVWLESLQPYEGDREALYRLLAVKGFGVEDRPLYTAYCKRMMVGMIARAVEPGCKHDTMPILTGAQGSKKSSAFAALMPVADWFSDTQLNIKNPKECVERMIGVWLQEWGELASMTSASFGEVKQFTASSRDQLRLAYGRYSTSVPRTVCRVGTSNPQAVLHDLTGSRREWPMATTGTNPAWIAEHRDDLFACALADYRAGEQWWLTDAEDHQRKADSVFFRIGSEIETFVADYMDCRWAAHLEAVIKAYEIQATKTKRNDRKTIALVLAALGYHPKRVRVNGSQKKLYVLSGVSTDIIRALGNGWDSRQKYTHPSSDPRFQESL